MSVVHELDVLAGCISWAYRSSAVVSLVDWCVLSRCISRVYCFGSLACASVLMILSQLSYLWLNKVSAICCLVFCFGSCYVILFAIAVGA